MNTLTFRRLSLVVLILSASCAGFGGEGEVVLKYDDGTMEGKRSSTGGGHAVLFDRPEGGPWYLHAVEFFGARYGSRSAPDEDFLVYVTDAALKNYCKIGRPYGLAERGKEYWVRVDMPFVEVPDQFHVCLVFNPTRTKGVYVGMDKNGKEARSRSAVPDVHSKPLDATTNWMIRAHLTRTAAGETTKLLTPEQREQKRQAEVAAAEAKLLKGAKSLLLKHDNGRMDNYQSYGGSTAQTVAFGVPEGEWYAYGISFSGAQYGGRHDSEAVNGDVYILDEGMRVISRTSFPYSLLTYKRAWIEVPVLPTKVSGACFVAIHAHSERYKGLYVGYSTDVKDGHSWIGKVKKEHLDLKPVPKPMEWMIRLRLADKPVYRE